MSDQQSRFKSGPFEAVAHALRRRNANLAANDIARQEARLPGHDPQRLERIAAYARSGYFNLNFGVDLLTGSPEIPSEYWGK
jgi:hypothetical protein